MTSLEVLGAGLGRTSTASLKLALEKLGYNVHHMSEVGRKGDFDQWIKIHKLGMADSEVKAGRILEVAFQWRPMTGNFQVLKISWMAIRRVVTIQLVDLFSNSLK